MSDPKATDEQIDSLEAFYNYVKDESGYKGSVTQQWVDTSAQYLNQQEIQKVVITN
ncbi:MAG: hypothetical protein HC874_32115 [Richelia sp. SL_2_1]|nr:hypothetical protein [Richelia sp. SL_2_1]